MDTVVIVTEKLSFISKKGILSFFIYFINQRFNRKYQDFDSHLVYYFRL